MIELVMRFIFSIHRPATGIYMFQQRDALSDKRHDRHASSLTCRPNQRLKILSLLSPHPERCLQLAGCTSITGTLRELCSWPRNVGLHERSFAEELWRSNVLDTGTLQFCGRGRGPKGYADLKEDAILPVEHNRVKSRAEAAHREGTVREWVKLGHTVLTLSLAVSSQDYEDPLAMYTAR
jgi:hypothetical protein